MPEQLAAMPVDVEKLKSKIERAVADEQLMESSAEPSGWLYLALNEQ